MITKEGRFRARDGLAIFWKAFLPQAPPKAVVHVIHGFAEHIDRYKNVIDELVPAGYVVAGTEYDEGGNVSGLDLYAAAVPKAIITEYSDLLRKSGFSKCVKNPRKLGCRRDFTKVIPSTYHSKRSIYLQTTYQLLGIGVFKNYFCNVGPSYSTSIFRGSPIQKSRTRDKFFNANQLQNSD